MNRHRHDETVYRVAADTLESLALMFLVPEDEAPQPRPSSARSPSGCDKWAAVSFTGPFDGALVLAASNGVLPELAANMLGLDTGCSATLEQQEDALKELANVICGNLLPAVAGAEPVFHISAPETLAAGPSPRAAEPLLLAGAARLLVDVGSLELSFLVARPSPVST